MSIEEELQGRAKTGNEAHDDEKFLGGRIGGVLNTEIDQAPLRHRMMDEAKAQGVSIDEDMVLSILARMIGWYRIESDRQIARTPREQRTEAEELVALLTELRSRLQPHNMSPDFRALLQDNMRELGVSAPDLSRLEVCARNAGERLPKPRKGERLDTGPKYNAIRQTYEAIRMYTVPSMNVEPAAALAADLVGIAAGVRVPTDRDELRAITRGN